jgi:hypothetical protein
MSKRRSHATAALAIVAACAASPLACNAFASLDRCTSDAQCPSGTTCDPEGRFCLKVVFAEAAVPDAAPDVVVEDVVVVDAPPPPCDLTKPFGTPVLVPGLELLAVSTARFSPNERTVIFSALNGGPEEFRADLFTATRPDLASPFTGAKEIPIVNTKLASEYWPTITADGRVMFFESGRSTEKVDGSYITERARIWSTMRGNTVSDFLEPQIQSVFSVDASSGGEASPYLHPGGRSLYFASWERGGKGGSDIFVAELEDFGFVKSVTNIDVVNTPQGELFPVVSLDDKVLYYSTEIAGKRNIFVSRRAAPGAAFGAPQPLAELNLPGSEQFPSWVSDDQCRLYFGSDRPAPGNEDGATSFTQLRTWVASRP